MTAKDKLNTSMSKTNEVVVMAHRKGYRVTEEGKVVNAVGRFRKCQVKTSNGDARFVFNIAIGGGEVFPVLVHKLQGFQKFGDAMFAPSVQVRHLDGDALNNRTDNIAIGTPSDNAMDRHPVARQLHAQKGNRGKGAACEATWSSISLDHQEGMGYKKLRAKYGVGLSALSYRLSRTSKYRLLENR